MVEAVLLPYQQRWVADKSPVKMWTKSRRIGASFGEASDATLLAARADGMNVTYICYDKDITRQFIKDCAQWAKAYKLAVKKVDLEGEEVFRGGDEDKSILVYRIYFDSGFEIEAIAGTPRKLRGRKGRIIIDEAAFLDDLKGVLKAALALLVWGGDLRLITTYNGVANDYYELEQDVLAGKRPYSRHFTPFEQAIEEGLYRRICRVNGWDWSLEAEFKFIADTRSYYGDDAAEELDCIPNKGGGRYFSLAILERAMARPLGPVITYACTDEFAVLPEQRRIADTNAWIREFLEPLCEEHLNPAHKSYYGMDFARLVDLSVIMPLQENELLERVCPFGIELRNVPFEQQKQVLWWLILRLPRFMAGAHDAGGNGQWLAEVTAQQFGATRISQIHLSRQWYGDNFPRYRAAIEDGRYRLPASADWKHDHRLVELNKGIPLIPDVRKKDADGLKRHGDAAVAGVLADFATRNEAVPIEFTAMNSRSPALSAYEATPARRSPFDRSRSVGRPGLGGFEL
ncbi:MAG: hypothetical protein ACFB0C_19610 [Leptolyngbyaceae cyanobacterium]